MAKAAVHLTPVVLELGGKSPAIVGMDTNIKVAARRIAWGKFMNAGQTCIAPDYLLVHSSVRVKLVAEIKKVLLEFYGSEVIKSPDYCRIINEKNFDRLIKLKSGIKVLHGGEAQRDQLFIEPTLVEALASDAVMQDEIFGPILPIIEMNDLAQIIGFIAARPKPLAVYIFSSDQTFTNQIIEGTSSGAICVNDVVMHMPETMLPFGGVGESGTGNYHGKYSFKTFTHAKGVLQKLTWPDIPIRYPPYTEKKAKWLKRLFQW